MVKICVSVPVTSTGAAVEAMCGLATPDIIELRLDYATDRLDLAKLRESTNTPLMATVRLSAHGGRWVGGEGERQQLLISAARAGFDYLDVEADSISVAELVGKLHESHVSVVVSHHFLERTPSLQETLAIHYEAKRAGADVVKVVGTAMSPADNLPCLEYLAREPGNVSFAMGAYGVLSRVLSPLIGGAWTYVSSEVGSEVSPGQMALTSLREAYKLMGVSQ